MNERPVYYPHKTIATLPKCINYPRNAQKLIYKLAWARLSYENGIPGQVGTPSSRAMLVSSVKTWKCSVNWGTKQLNSIYLSLLAKPSFSLIFGLSVLLLYICLSSLAKPPSLSSTGSVSWLSVNIQIMHTQVCITRFKV